MSNGSLSPERSPTELPTFFQRRRLRIGVARIIYGPNKSSAVLNEEEIVGEQLFQLAVHLSTFDDGQAFADDLASILNVHFDEPRPIVLFDNGERDLANGKNDHEQGRRNFLRGNARSAR